MVKIKICGVRTRPAALTLKELNVDFAGFNFVPSSRRLVTVDEAAPLMAELGPATQPVAVFKDQSETEITQIADALSVNWIQLHGSEPIGLGLALAKRYHLIRAISVHSSTLPHQQLSQWTPAAKYFLFDGPNAGSGTPFSWDRLKNLSSPLPFFVAGGLNPHNVADAIHALHPFGVDTASGVEANGVQSTERIRALVHAVSSS